MSSSTIFLHDFLVPNDGSQGPFELTTVPSQRINFRRERSPSLEDNESIFKSARTDYQSDLIADPPLPRRRVAKKTTISKSIPTNNNNKTPINQQRTRRITADDTYDEITHYTPPSRQSSQPIMNVNNNEEIGLSRIPDQPLLPTFSDKVQHELLMGNPELIMNELIREAADFYMNVYPQLTHGVEYKKIGIALINEYPCLACEDTINPHGLITSRLSARIRNVRRKMRTREQKCQMRGTIY
ncbi:unnamed protein product [Adineta steineri]|uniref:Uncharacterized protein n=1 Tax=Adineta steineri TaxID=433720 RepID=A0A819B045_9BILA|nr:unnamed protein product [Adineta steineri]CAF1288218.1 unnamed protein product [Adineta steineri]CAF1505703.1 unnamed protein product [Adineta steineri]CAF1589961.1 unnamed protein product [Adineta steineri]CAF1589975.1 unnamed protein product [Adineta steineri]